MLFDFDEDIYRMMVERTLFWYRFAKSLEQMNNTVYILQSRIIEQSTKLQAKNKYVIRNMLWKRAERKY